MKRRHLCLIALVCVAAGAPSVRAADSPAGAFPSDVSVVVRLADTTETLKKVKDLASGVNLNDDLNGKILMGIEVAGAGVGNAIDNPARQGVKPETDWWIAVIAGKDSRPATIYAVEASDAGALKDAVDEDYKFITYENWTIYTKDDAAAKSIEAVVAGEAESILTMATDGITELFDASDAAAFVNLKALKVTFADEVEQFRTEFQSALADIETELESQPIPIEGVNIKAVMDMYAQVFAGLLTAFDDSNSLSAGISIDGDGILVRELVEFQPDSSTDKFLRIHKPSSMATLAKLPTDQLLYFGVHVDTRSLTEWGMKYVSSLLDLEDAELEKFKASAAELAKLEMGSAVSSFGLGTRETGFISATSISEVKGPNAKEIQRKAYQMMADNLGGGGAPGIGMFQSVEVETDAEKVGDISVDLRKMELGASEIDPSGDLVRRLMTILFGPEGMVTRVAYAPGHVVETVGGGRGNMERALNRLSSSAPDEAFLATRKNLSNESNLIYMIDLPGLLTEALQAVAENAPFAIPIDLSAIQAMDLKRSYVGYSAKTAPGSLAIQGYVPRGQIQGMGTLILFGIQQYKMFNQGAAF